MKIFKKTLKPFYYFFTRYIVNIIVSYFPAWGIRRIYYKICGLKLGKGSVIDMGNYFLEIRRINIGDFTHINQGCILDGRGGVCIGNNVSISHRVTIMTGSHDMNSEVFKGVFKSIIIKDYVWIGVNATILQGVTIGRGAVIAAGSVVTKDIGDFEVFAGIPAKKIATRSSNIDYNCRPNALFL